MVFAPKGEYAADKVFKSLDHLVASFRSFLYCFTHSILKRADLLHVSPVVSSRQAL